MKQLTVGIVAALIVSTVAALGSANATVTPGTTVVANPVKSALNSLDGQCVGCVADLIAESTSGTPIDVLAEVTVTPAYHDGYCFGPAPACTNARRCNITVEVDVETLAAFEEHDIDWEFEQNGETLIEGTETTLVTGYLFLSKWVPCGISDSHPVNFNVTVNGVTYTYTILCDSCGPN